MTVHRNDTIVLNGREANTPMACCQFFHILIHLLIDCAVIQNTYAKY